MNGPALHGLILTLNEERHIQRCIESLQGQCASILVVDSGSSDRTCDIARSLGAEILVHPFVTHAGQVNVAIDHLADRGGWLLRIDADEIFDKDSNQSLAQALTGAGAGAGAGVDGLLVQRRIHFMGRRIRHGGIEPIWQLRLWRNGQGRCEQRWMDEHIRVQGDVEKSGVILSDINLNSLTWWTAKHNSYASREVIDQLGRRHGFAAGDGIEQGGGAAQARLKRLIKHQFYHRLPGGLRALAYFFYRYALRGGFLDGRAGWYFHLLQALWYRTLVDAKASEIEAFARIHNMPITEAIHDRTGIDPLADREGQGSGAA